MKTPRLRARPDIQKGDYVHIDEDIFSPGFLGICIDGYRNRPIRMCDVYGFFHEAGSVYANQLTRLSVDKKGFKEYLAALYKSIQELTRRPPDWEPEDIERNHFLSQMKMSHLRDLTYFLQRMKKVSTNVYLRTVKAAFNTAARLNLIQQNPFRGCGLFRIPAQDPVYITKEEFAGLLAAIQDNRFRVFVLFAVLTGMRRGELIGLRWSAPASVQRSPHYLTIQHLHELRPPTRTGEQSWLSVDPCSAISCPAHLLVFCGNRNRRACLLTHLC